MSGQQPGDRVRVLDGDFAGSIGTVVGLEGDEVLVALDTKYPVGMVVIGEPANFEPALDGATAGNPIGPDSEMFRMPPTLHRNETGETP